MTFIFGVRNHHFIVVNGDNKTIYIIQFFSNLRSESVFLFFSGADGLNLSVFCSISMA